MSKHLIMALAIGSDTFSTALDGGTAPVATPAISSAPIISLHLREYLLIKTEYAALSLGSTETDFLIIMIILSDFMTFLSKSEEKVRNNTAHAIRSYAHCIVLMLWTLIVAL